jgi:hypothetical protein
MTEPNQNPPPPSYDPAAAPASDPAPAPSPAPSVTTPPPYTGDPQAQSPAPPQQPQPAAPIDYGRPGAAGALPYAGPAPTADDRTMGMLAHLLGIFTGFVGPLIIWMVKREQSPFVDDQGREALNFQLTMLIGWLIAGASTAVCIGFLLMPAVLVVAIIFGVIGAMAANKGEAYRYPINIRFIK